MFSNEIRKGNGTERSGASKDGNFGRGGCGRMMMENGGEPTPLTLLSKKSPNLFIPFTRVHPVECVEIMRGAWVCYLGGGERGEGGVGRISFPSKRCVHCRAVRRGQRRRRSGDNAIHHINPESSQDLSPVLTCAVHKKWSLPSSLQAMRGRGRRGAIGRDQTNPCPPSGDHQIQQNLTAGLRSLIQLFWHRAGRTR